MIPSVEKFADQIKGYHFHQRTGVRVVGLVGNLTRVKKGKFRAKKELDSGSSSGPLPKLSDTCQVGLLENSGVGIKGVYICVSKEILIRTIVRRKTDALKTAPALKRRRSADRNY